MGGLKGEYVIRGFRVRGTPVERSCKYNMRLIHPLPHSPPHAHDHPCHHPPLPYQQLEELSADLGWAPPVAAVIEHDPNIQTAQDQRIAPILRSEKLARGVRQLISTLFPGMERAIQQTETQSTKSFLRLPKFKFG